MGPTKYINFLTLIKYSILLDVWLKRLNISMKISNTRYATWVNGHAQWAVLLAWMNSHHKCKWGKPHIRGQKWYLTLKLHKMPRMLPISIGLTQWSILYVVWPRCTNQETHRFHLDPSATKSIVIWGKERSLKDKK